MSYILERDPAYVLRNGDIVARPGANPYQIADLGIRRLRVQNLTDPTLGPRNKGFEIHAWAGVTLNYLIKSLMKLWIGRQRKFVVWRLRNVDQIKIKKLKNGSIRRTITRLDWDAPPALMVFKPGKRYSTSPVYSLPLPLP